MWGAGSEGRNQVTDRGAVAFHPCSPVSGKADKQTAGAGARSGMFGLFLGSSPLLKSAIAGDEVFGRFIWGGGWRFLQEDGVVQPLPGWEPSSSHSALILT